VSPDGNPDLEKNTGEEKMAGSQVNVFQVRNLVYLSSWNAMDLKRADLYLSPLLLLPNEFVFNDFPLFFMVVKVSAIKHVSPIFKGLPSIFSIKGL
jgi:hypothetical protein